MIGKTIKNFWLSPETTIDILFTDGTSISFYTHNDYGDTEISYKENNNSYSLLKLGKITDLEYVELCEKEKVKFENKKILEEEELYKKLKEKFEK